MNDPHNELHSLIHAVLDGRASDDESERLNELLRINVEALDVSLQLADAHACLAVDEKLWVNDRERDNVVRNLLSQAPEHSIPRKRFLTRMALSTAICESFHRNRSSGVAIESSVYFGCLQGTASRGATDYSILILWLQLVCQNFATFFHPLSQR